MNSTLTLQQTLRTLVAAKSVSSTQPELDCSNQNVIETLADWLDALGFEIELQVLPNHNGKFNLIATLGEGTQGLVFSGHTDTVPYDAQLWNSDPFSLHAEQGNFYGLGSCDMKGFFSSLLQAISQLELRRLKQPIVVLATADEESTMSGARYLQKQSERLGRYCVIGEPTQLQPVRQHKGIYIEEVKLTGQSGHSSNPGLGNNALDGMHQVMSLLIKERESLSKKFFDPNFIVPTPTLNLGHIHGGDNANRICGECVLHYDFRLLPNMDLETLRNHQRDQIQTLASSLDLMCEIKPLFDGVPALSTPADCLLVKTAERITGMRSESVTFATEGPFLQSLGMETIILGPGSISVAHKPNEYVSVSDLQRATSVYQKLIEEFCY